MGKTVFVNYSSTNPHGQGPETDLFQDVHVTLHYASFFQRLVAAIIDGIVLQVINGLIAAAMGYRFFDTEREYFDTPGIIGLVIYWLYFALQESGAPQATLGKRAMGIRVCREDGTAISFAQATGRHFAKYLSALILLIGYLMMLWDSRKQTLHDKLANTFVVENR